MSDVTVAPNASPPPTNEVAIEQNPTGSPQPIGSQAPQKQGMVDNEGSKHRPESRRESIKRAFDRAANAKPAEPKMGHNNPPEKMEREKPAPLDLKKRPADQPQRERGEHGHFAKRPEGREPPPGEQGVAPQQQPGAQQQRQAQQRYNPLPETAPYRDAPQRMTERARADWAGTPESVRADVHRMQQEFAGAYQRYRGDHEAMNEIRPFHQMAAEHGTTLHRALSNYVGMEQKLRQDVVGGLDIIVNNLNLRTPDGRKLTLRDVAHHILSQTPEQHRLIQSGNAQMAQSHQLQQTNERLAGLENMLAQMHHAERFRQTRGAVDQYADDGRHPRFDELADLIEAEVSLGFDLETAYRRAEMLRPGTRAAQTRTNGSADRSIRGAPDAGPSNGTSQRKSGKPVGRREAIANAIKRVNGSL